MGKQKDEAARRKLLERWGDWVYTQEKRDKARLAIADAVGMRLNDSCRLRLRALAGGNGAGRI